MNNIITNNTLRIIIKGSRVRERISRRTQRIRPIHRAIKKAAPNAIAYVSRLLISKVSGKLNPLFMA